MFLLMGLLFGCSPDTDLPLTGTWERRTALTDKHDSPRCGEWVLFLTLTEDHTLYYDEYVNPIFVDADTHAFINGCSHHQNTYKYWRHSEGNWEQFDLGNTHQLGLRFQTGYISPITIDDAQASEAAYGVETSWVQYPVTLADEDAVLHLKPWGTFRRIERTDIEGPWDTADTGDATDPGNGFP